MPNINSDPLSAEIKSFRQRWEAEFKKVAVLHKRGARENRGWRSGKTYKDLLRNGDLELVLPDEDVGEVFYQPLTYGLARESYLYRTFAANHKITKNNNCFRDALKIIDSALKGLARTSIEDAPVKNTVLGAIEKLRIEAQNVRHSLQQIWDSYAEKALAASIAERMKWDVVVDKGKVTSVKSAETAHWEQIFNQYSYPKKFRKESQLDTYFQVRVGAILRNYLFRGSTPIIASMPTYGVVKGVSYATIVRLTLLTYIAANLAEYKNGKLINLHRGTRLTPTGVLQNQQRAGLK